MLAMITSNVIELLREKYARFNARDADGVLTAMPPDVAWPNGWEGGWVHGREAVREYWTRQWAEIDPHVEPVEFEAAEDRRVRVKVVQTVRDLSGGLLFQGNVGHVYTFEDGLVSRMQIENFA